MTHIFHHTFKSGETATLVCELNGPPDKPFSMMARPRGIHKKFPEEFDQWVKILCEDILNELTVEQIIAVAKAVGKLK